MNQTVLALDVGEKRIGVARANAAVRLATPLITLTNDDGVWDRLRKLIEDEQVATLVVGLPRGLEGQETAQTKNVQEFIEELQERLMIPVVTRYEAVTSVQAEAELKQRGKPYEKGEVDALAATYILQDYLEDLR